MRSDQAQITAVGTDDGLYGYGSRYGDCYVYNLVTDEVIEGGFGSPATAAARAAALNQQARYNLDLQAATVTPPWRILDDTECRASRKWAQSNYRTDAPISPAWHPIVRDECNQINQAAAEAIADILINATADDIPAITADFAAGQELIRQEHAAYDGLIGQATRKESCPWCDGGQDEEVRHCGRCDGSGLITVPCADNEVEEGFNDAHAQSEYADGDSGWLINAIDQGRYDDDPSPYDGTYSEE